MKQLLVVFLALLFIAFSVQAQSQIGIFGGYGKSNFDLSDENGEDSGLDQSSFIPVGAELLFGSKFQIGAEVSYSVSPFSFKAEEGGVTYVEERISQILVGGVVKIHFGEGTIRPFVRGGAGLYMGKDEIDFNEEFSQFLGVTDTTINFKSAFGFNFGGGLKFQLGENSFLFGEFVYHMVKRELDVEGAEKMKMDNWAIRGGIEFGL